VVATNGSSSTVESSAAAQTNAVSDNRWAVAANASMPSSELPGVDDPTPSSGSSPSGGSALTATELRRRLREKLPEYMVPSAFVMLDALPLTPNGKVDRKRLPKPERMHAEAEYVAPRTPVEEVISSIWSAVLRLERVGIHDNFFELGGHSLLATQVTFSIREKLGVELPLRRIFETPTVAGLAELVATSNVHETPTIKPLSRDRYRVKGFTPQALSLPEVMRER
ncbi:MAG TPA: phosphopantetheine-binding protein, partial [Pyrinomonadaceae bacterium]|nr:phosphopantetheine-binding protein [Pyrinomonadaceae bacterium]